MKIIVATVTGAFYGSIRQIQEGLETVNSINKSQTNIRMIAGISRDEVEGLTDDLGKLADKLGDTSTNMLAGGEEFLRAGFKDSDLDTLISTNTMLSKISAQTQEETSQQIIAIKNAYELSSGEMQGVADKLTQVDSQSATSTKELATAIQHTAESARLAGTDFDNLVSYIATVSETSRKSASSIGESFKTMFARFQNIKLGKAMDDEGQSLSDVETVLNSLDIALRKDKEHFRDFDDVIKQVGGSWSKYNDIQKSEIANAIAGEFVFARYNSNVVV